MKDIVITEDFSEAVEIGKDIFAEKNKIYTESLVRMIKRVIDKNMPDASAKEKEDMFYHSIYDYWVYGVHVSEEFYFNYTKLNDKQKREYATIRDHVLFVEHLNKKEDAYILNNKYETYKRFKDLFRRDVILLESDKDYNTFCDFVSKHKTFVVKPLDLGLGIGVRKMTMPDDADLKCVFDSLIEEGKSYDGESHSAGGRSVILEELIKQSDSIGCLHPDSVNGVRVTTVRVGDKIHIYHPWIKIGVNGDFITSAFMGSIDAAIAPETGIIETVGIGEFGQREEYHPNTHIRIKDFRIPRWDELVKIATEISLSLPTLRYIGWDFALTDDGWCIMEGNYSGDFLWQLLYGKGMKAEFEELIGWKIDKKFWWE